MEARTATAKDLAIVFRELAGRMSSEYSAAGFNTRKAKDALMMNLWEGRGHALLQNGQPVAIFVWEDDGGTISTSFAAHESFFTASTVRFCKRHIRNIQKLCGNLPVRSDSWTNREEVSRWFRVIGFTDIDRGEKHVLYELQPAL